jgi:hypothetical protein
MYVIIQQKPAIRLMKPFMHPKGDQWVIFVGRYQLIHQAIESACEFTVAWETSTPRYLATNHHLHVTIFTNLLHCCQVRLTQSP